MEDTEAVGPAFHPGREYRVEVAEHGKAVQVAVGYRLVSSSLEAPGIVARNEAGAEHHRIRCHVELDHASSLVHPTHVHHLGKDPAAYVKHDLHELFLASRNRSRLDLTHEVREAEGAELAHHHHRRHAGRGFGDTPFL
eukprot:3591810-Prymnesium_polylepis.1